MMMITHQQSWICTTPLQQLDHMRMRSISIGKQGQSATYLTLLIANSHLTTHLTLRPLISRMQSPALRPALIASPLWSIVRMNTGELPPIVKPNPRLLLSICISLYRYQQLNKGVASSRITIVFIPCSCGEVWNTTKMPT